MKGIVDANGEAKLDVEADVDDVDEEAKLDDEADVDEEAKLDDEADIDDVDVAVVETEDAVEDTI
jgi:hypothetical protein